MKSLNKVADFVHSIVKHKPTQSEQLFKEIMSDKILHKLANKRSEIAQHLFKEELSGDDGPCFIKYEGDTKGSICYKACSSKEEAAKILKKYKNPVIVKSKK